MRNPAERERNRKYATKIKHSYFFPVIVVSTGNILMHLHSNVRFPELGNMCISLMNL